MSEEEKDNSVSAGPSQGKPEDSSGIHELNRQLYAREESGALKDRQNIFSKRDLSEKKDLLPQEKSIEDAGESDFVNITNRRIARRRKIIHYSLYATLFIVVFVSAIAATLGYRRSQQVTPEQMELSLSAPHEFTSGERITYVLRYKNSSRVAWEDVEIVFGAPNGFRYISSDPETSEQGRSRVVHIGRLEPGEEGEATITGQLVGEQGAPALARAELTITPANLPRGRLTKSETITTTIAIVPIEVSIEMVENAARGERVVVTMRVRNASSEPIEGAHLRLNAPVGTQIMAEDSTFSPGFSPLDSWWELPALNPLEEISRVAVIVLEGEAGERRTIDAEILIREGDDLFVQRSVNYVVTISAAELAIEQLISGTTDPQVLRTGQKVEGTVRYRNVGTVGLTDVVVRVRFEGVGFDASTLRLESGSYDPNTRTATWTAASVPDLTTMLPQEEGELAYEFTVLEADRFPVGEDAKNQAITVTAVIDSPDLRVPIGQEETMVVNRVLLPIGTDLTLVTDAFYDDGRLGLASTGPLPPRVGEETTYTIRFRLGSTLNDAGEMRMTAVLPDGVTYKGNMYKTTGEMEYNNRTGEIVWTIPLVEGLTGRASPPAELHVQVGIIPGDNLRGSVVSLLHRAGAVALDMYIDQNIDQEVPGAMLPTTETASPQQGRVE